MNVGLRALLLLVATVLFIIGIFVEPENQLDFITIGLACLAGAFAVSDLGWDRRVGTRR
jgi:hypothetical protein